METIRVKQQSFFICGFLSPYCKEPCDSIDKVFNAIKIIIEKENLDDKWYLDSIQPTDTQGEYEVILERVISDD